MIRLLAPLALAALTACAPPPSAQATDQMALGVKLMQADQPTMALAAFNRALAEEVTADRLTAAAAAYHALGRSKEARRLLEAAIDRDPNFALARNNLGILHFEAGRLPVAVEELSRAYALTEGRDPAVARNLDMATDALSRARVAEAEARAAAPSRDYDIVRYGHGRFALRPAKDDAE